LSRIKELPRSFYTGYASLDEFLSTASTSDNNQGHGKDKCNGKTHHKKHSRERMTSNTQNTSAKQHNVNSNGAVIKMPVLQTVNAPSTSQIGKKRKYKGAQDAIDEMNRQYDHNTCLDRFINDIEQNQKQQPQQQQHQNQNCDRTCNGSPSNSSSNSSGSSSARPNSNEDTDSTSRISESIKSSNPENGKNEKEENSSGSNSSNDTKEDKQPEKGSNNMLSCPTSIEGVNIVAGAQQKSSSLESGIGSTVTEDTHSMSSNQVDSLNDKAKNYKGGKLGRKRKRGYIYNPKPVIEKPPKQFVPDTDKDKSYWEKRQRNNKAARRSREMRRVKEKETHDKLVRLKNENEALRVAITLLIQRNENLEFIIDELEKTENALTSKVPTVPVTVLYHCRKQKKTEPT